MHNTLEGQAFTIFSLTVAACEAGIALSLILALYQGSRSLDVELWVDLREPDLPSPVTPEELSTAGLELPDHEELPSLAPAGRLPQLRARPPARADERAADSNGKPEIPASLEKR
jgi:NADH-quinone oxidoreductase subunit K